ncbi:MAG TPA: STAS domain-containing protein [bacterium]|nr:STAS domain-containing protein [bacterium]
MANFRLSGDTAFIGGDLTVNSGAAIQTFLRNLQVRQNDLTIDLRGAEVWDSATIQLFLSWIRSRQGGAVVWRNMPRDMAGDLRIMGLAKLFNGATHEQ